MADFRHKGVCMILKNCEKLLWLVGAVLWLFQWDVSSKLTVEKDLIKLDE
jgi:hypothetical protein